mgnify:CR=1 FL=1
MVVTTRSKARKNKVPQVGLHNLLPNELIKQINNQTNISPEDIPLNSWVKMILEVQAIWINSNGFGLFIKPILVSFIPIEIKKYKFIEDSEDDVDDVIDDNSSIFLNAQEQNNIESTNETSVLKLNSVEDSLELDARTKFSSTSSEDMKHSSPINENP